jgi:hypothetical protein
MASMQDQLRYYQEVAKKHYPYESITHKVNKFMNGGAVQFVKPHIPTRY